MASCGGRAASRSPQGESSIGFRLWPRLSPSGRVTNLQHLETQPREITDFNKVVGRTLRRLIYRPRLKDGAVVATGDVVYTHDFYYRPNDLPKLAPPDPEVPADEQVSEDTATQDDTTQE